MATRKRRPAGRRAEKKGSPAGLWLLAGILIGLGLAYFLWARGYIPAPDIQKPESSQSGKSERAESAIAEKSSAEPEVAKPRYDFFTVLPEMEVVVPEQELKDSSATQSQAPQQDSETYLLQVGSFRSAGDADQMKARLALLGMSAKVQTVDVNDSTWHRVRIGPITGARAADDLRNRLTKNDIDSLILKNP